MGLNGINSTKVDGYFTDIAQGPNGNKVELGEALKQMFSKSRDDFLKEKENGKLYEGAVFQPNTYIYKGRFYEPIMSYAPFDVNGDKIIDEKDIIFDTILITGDTNDDGKDDKNDKRIYADNASLMPEGREYQGTQFVSGQKGIFYNLNRDIVLSFNSGDIVVSEGATKHAYDIELEEKDAEYHNLKMNLLNKILDKSGIQGNLRKYIISETLASTCRNNPDNRPTDSNPYGKGYKDAITRTLLRDIYLSQEPGLNGKTECQQ